MPFGFLVLGVTLMAEREEGLFVFLPPLPRPTGSPVFPYTTLFRSKHWGLRKSRNAPSLNSRFKSLDTLKVKIISVTFRRVIRTNHKKASKIWRHENIQLGGCQS